MNPSFGKSSVWKPWHRALVGGMAIAALCLTFAGEAKAACVSKDANPGPSVALPKIRFDGQAAARCRAARRPNRHNSIVGLWNVTLLLGSGPDVFDQGFQHWHADGTELMVDNAVAPAFGNVCVGVWKQVGARTYKLKHMTFNWDAQGKVAGTFILEMTRQARLARQRVRGHIRDRQLRPRRQRHPRAPRRGGRARLAHHRAVGYGRHQGVRALLQQRAGPVLAARGSRSARGSRVAARQ